MRLLSNLWWRIVHLGFRLLYYELAFTYDLVSKVVSLGEWRDWQRTVFQHMPPSDDGLVLELAHGTGDLQLDLLEHEYSTIGYDLSPYMGKLAKRKLLNQKLPANLVLGRAQALPFPNNRFRSVVSTFPTDFIFQSATLSEINRVLINQGSLLVVLSGTFEGTGPLRKVLEWLYRITGQRGIENHVEDTYKRIKRQLHGAGFDAKIVEETCSRSTALLVVAHKIVLPN